MYKSLRKFTGILIAIVMVMTGLTCTTYAAGKPTNVVVNSVSVKINNKAVKIDNLSYAGKIFLQPQDVSSLLKIGYAYDVKSKTVSIYSKKPAKPVALAKAKFTNVKANTSKGLQMTINPVIIKIDGKVIKADSFIYDNAVYVSSKEMAASLSMDYMLNAKAKTLVINEKKPGAPVFAPDIMDKTRGKVTVTITEWGNAQKKEYKVDNGPWKNYTSPVMMTANGTIYAKGTNAAGISSDVASMKVDNILTLLSKTEVSKQSASVVKIVEYDANGVEMGNGSGFIVSSDGKVVTNYHVIDMIPELSVITSDNKEYSVKGVLAYSVKQDIAVLQIDTNDLLPSVYLGDSENVELGEDILAIGYPLGMQCTVSFGNVSSLNTPGGLSRKDYKDIQITAPISHGNSGGPTFNMYGEVIGINYSSIVNGQNLNYTIPINELKSFLSSNTMKSTSDIIKEVYPQMNYDEYEAYLFYNYPVFKSGNYNFCFDNIWVDEYSKDPNEVDVCLSLGADNYKTVLSAKNDGNKKDVEKWMEDIYTKVKAQFSDKSVYVYIVYQEKFDSKPNGFAEDEISYISDSSVWLVTKYIAEYYYEYGNLKVTWY